MEVWYLEETISKCWGRQLSVKCLLCKHEDLSSVPKTAVEKARHGDEMHAYNPCSREVVTRQPKEQHPRLISDYHRHVHIVHTHMHRERERERERERKKERDGERQRGREVLVPLRGWPGGNSLAIRIMYLKGIV